MTDITNLNSAQTAEVAKYVARTQFGHNLPPASAAAAADLKSQAETSKNALNLVINGAVAGSGGLIDPNQKLPIANLEAVSPGVTNQIQQLLPPGYTVPSSISLNDLRNTSNKVLDSIIQQASAGASVIARPISESGPTTTNPRTTLPPPLVTTTPVQPRPAVKSAGGVSKFVKDIAKNTINNLLGGGPNGVGDSNPQGLKKGIVQDWTHATKVFVGGDMLRMPKYKGMFHVTFVINPEAFNVGLDALKTNVPSDTLSVLTKSVELPKFSIDYSTLNQYNHTSIHYKKMKYEPINVTFHDDMADIVTTFWYFYYAYYFADASKPYESGAAGGGGGGGLFAGLINKGINAIKGAISKGINSIKNKLFGKKSSGDGGKGGGSQPTINEAKDAYESFRKYANGIMYGDKGDKQLTDRAFSWGLNGTPYHINGGKEKNVPFLQAIEIYPLGNKKASMIVLQNPKIVAWQHDTFDYSAQGTATCTATIAYEGVTYKDQIDAKTILDNVSMYDRHGAPGSGKTGGVFSFIDKVDGILGKASRGEKLTGSDIITTLGAAKSLFKKGGGG